eukprot:129245-Pelagomonas_calceolata.AAC.1
MEALRYRSCSHCWRWTRMEGTKMETTLSACSSAPAILPCAVIATGPGQRCLTDHHARPLLLTVPSHHA